MPRPIPSQHILVVDDEPMVRDALKMVLTFEGNTVELASDGPEALQKVAEKKFDIIFTDYKMPQMSGDDLARCIKKKYPDQVIVMVTAYACFLSSSQKRTMPIDFIVTKPFDLQTIVDAVKRAYEINKANRRKTGPSPPPPNTPS